jgi:ABC-2 type transport system permease protein
MSIIWTITKKELKHYFKTPIAYVYMVAFVFFNGWMFFNSFFLRGQADMRPFFDLIPWVFIFLVPAITMNIWSEEKKQGTLELLMTMPISDFQVLLGKYYAAKIFLLISIVVTFPIAFTIGLLGDPDVGMIIAGYIGTFFMGMAYLSIGGFVSAITDNQIISFIVSVFLIFFLYILGEPFFLNAIPEAIAPLAKFLGMSTHFKSVGRGVIDIRDIIYYLSVITFFVFNNVLVLNSRRYK